MRHGRRQFTLRRLMGLVALAGFEMALLDSAMRKSAGHTGADKIIHTGSCQWTRIVTRLVNPNCYEF